MSAALDWLAFKNPPPPPGPPPPKPPRKRPPPKDGAPPAEPGVVVLPRARTAGDATSGNHPGSPRAGAAGTRTRAATGEGAAEGPAEAAAGEATSGEGPPGPPGHRPGSGSPTGWHPSVGCSRWPRSRTSGAASAAPSPSVAASATASLGTERSRGSSQDGDDARARPPPPRRDAARGTSPRCARGARTPTRRWQRGRPRARSGRPSWRGVATAPWWRSRPRRRAVAPTRPCSRDG